MHCTMPCCAPERFNVGAPSRSILAAVIAAKPSIAPKLIDFIGRPATSLEDVARAINPTPLLAIDDRASTAAAACMPREAVVLFVSGDDAQYAPVVDDDAAALQASLTPLVEYAAQTREIARSAANVLRAIENERRAIKLQLVNPTRAKGAPSTTAPLDLSFVIDHSPPATFPARAATTTPPPRPPQAHADAAVLLAPASIVHLVATPVWPPSCIDLNTGNNARPSIYTTLAGDAALLPLELRVENLDKAHVVFEALECPMCAMGNVCSGRQARVLNAPFDVRGLASRYACTRADECWPLRVGGFGAASHHRTKTRNFIKFYGKEGDLRYEKYLRTVSRFGYRISRPEFLGTSPALRIAGVDRDVTNSPLEANAVVLDAIDSTIFVLLGAPVPAPTLVKLRGARSINTLLVAIKHIRRDDDRVSAYRAPGRLALPFKMTGATDLSEDEMLFIGQTASIKYWKELMVLGAIKTLVGREHIPARLTDRTRDSLYDLLDTIMFTPTCQLESSSGGRARVDGQCFEMPVYGEHQHHARGDRKYAISCAQHRHSGALTDQTSIKFRRFCEEVTGGAIDDAMVASCYARYVDVLRSTMARINAHEYRTSSNVPRGSKRDKCVPRFIDEGIRCCCVRAGVSPPSSRPSGERATYAPDDIIDSYALDDLALVPDETNAMAHVSCTEASATPVRSSRAMCDFYDFHNALLAQALTRLPSDAARRYASFGQLRLTTRLFLQSAHTLEYKAIRGRMM